MGRINVLQLINSFEVGGLEKLLYYFVKNCDSKQFRTVVGALAAKGPLKKDFESLGVPVFSFGLRPGLDLRVIPGLWQVMRRERVHVLHTHNLGPHFYGSLAALASGVRLKVHTEHGIAAAPGDGGLLKHRFLDRKSDYVVAVSPEVETFVRKEWKPRCSLVTILNGVEFGNERPAGAQACREMMGIGAQDRVIGHVGRLSRVKDQSTLLRAFRIVHKKEKESHLVIVGSGPLQQELMSEAVSLGITDRVHFMGERHNVAEFLAGFDVFVLSSMSEGISIALLEAMAQGVAPVVTNVGGNGVVVRDGVNGFLCPVGNEQKLAEKIILLLEDEALREKMRGNAAVTARTDYSIQKMVSDYEAIYLKSLSQSGTG